MRKFFTAMGLMLSAFALMNCQKELVEDVAPASEPNFELFAQPVTPEPASVQPAPTKTVNDGLKTKWDADDEINVFHAAVGSATYTSDGKFTIQNAEEGRFSGTVASLDAGSYDWYAFYPYIDYMTETLNDGWALIGGASDKPLIQQGNSSTAHLSGDACPLYGVAKGVASGTAPSITMNHLSSVVKVTVTNNSGADFTVNSVSFIGTEEIAGWFKVDLTKSPVGYEAGNNVSSTASLSVDGGAAIANGASADFYIVIKPFEAEAGSVLTLAVNGYGKPLKLTENVTFTAGNIKTLNYNLDTKPESPEYLTAWYYKNNPHEQGDKATVLNAVKDNPWHYQGFLYTTGSDADQLHSHFLFQSSDGVKFYRGNDSQYSLTSAPGYYNLWSSHPGLNYVEVDLTSLIWKETQVSGIAVAGDFNGWSLSENPMTYNAETRRWEAMNVSVGETTAEDPRIQFVLGDWNWKYGDNDGTGRGALTLDDSGFKLEQGTYDFALDLRSFDTPRYSATRSGATYPTALYAYYYADGSKGNKAADLKAVEGKSGQYEGFLYTESNAVNFLFYNSEADDATVYWGDNSQYNLIDSQSWNLWSGHPGLNYVTVDLKMMEWTETVATPHVCGDFNQWKVTDENKMNYVGNNKWEATIYVGTAVREDGEATRIQFWLGNHNIRVYGDWDGTGTLKVDDPGFKFSDVGTYKFELDLTNLDAPTFSVTEVEQATAQQ